MPGDIPQATPAATNAAVNVARGLPQLVATLEQVNPAVAAQLTGSLQTYGKSAAAPIVGVIVGMVVSHYGLACSATAVTGCWSQGFIDNVTYALIAAGAGLGALVMHWISKWPARRVLAASAPVSTTQGPTP